jgi:G protein-coupled receptor 64/G protein-coupled receptor 126
MIGLSLVILTFMLFRKWRKSLGNKILFNFSLALFCVTGCFLCAGLVTFDHRMCKATAASMHYFLLASFGWMVVEGIYQYLNYVIVIGAQNYKSCFMRRASPVAWGLPILPVLGIFIYDPDLYAIGDEFCWLKLEAFYYTVLTPISLMLLFNILIFIGVLKNVLCLRINMLCFAKFIKNISCSNLFDVKNYLDSTLIYKKKPLQERKKTYQRLIFLPLDGSPTRAIFNGQNMGGTMTAIF